MWFLIIRGSRDELCESGGSALCRVSWFLVVRQDLQSSSSVFLLNVVGSTGTCWPRWTRRTWCRQPSTSKRTVDSVQGVWADGQPWNGETPSQCRRV